MTFEKLKLVYPLYSEARRLKREREKKERKQGREREEHIKVVEGSLETKYPSALETQAHLPSLLRIKLLSSFSFSSLFFFVLNVG